MPNAGDASGAGGMPGGPNFQYSGVDPDTARRLFESLFGGAAGGFGTASRGPTAGGPTRFQFFTTGRRSSSSRFSNSTSAGHSCSSRSGSICCIGMLQKKHNCSIERTCQVCLHPCAEQVPVSQL